jgi:para-nitrobenzyl esterase
MNFMNQIFIGLVIFLTGFYVFAIKPIRNGARRISTIVKTKEGLVEGMREKSGILAFKGIPFAAPPLGSLRWVAPQPVTSWSGIRKCQVFGPSPMQPKPAPYSMWSEEFQIPHEPISEDCLYLNLWTGAKLSTAKRPVLVWIYGGGFIRGGSGIPVNDGEALAKKGIVVVSINYRVGIFGFFAHPELTKESPQKVSGNYAMLDQIAALKWVRENIAAFGGDPENITIDGGSVGAMSVNYLIASPLAKGLFTKAIAQSGADFLKETPSSSDTLDPYLQQAEQEGIRISEQLKKPSLKELRNVSTEQLLKVNFREWSGPVVDGYFLQQSVPSIFKEHKENSVVLLTGWNEDEVLFEPVKSASDFQTDIKKKFGEYAKQLMIYYPASSDSEGAISQLKLSRDMYFGAQNFTFANIESSHGRPVYVYRFTRKVPGYGEYAKYGAFHGGEEFYSFDNLKFANRPWQNTDYELASIMSTYWVNFVKAGNPNGEGLPEWPIYETHLKKIIDLGNHTSATVLRDSATLEFLSSILNPN